MATVVSLDVYYTNADHTALVAQLRNPSGFIPFQITFSGAANNTVSGSCLVVGWDAVTATADVTRGSFTLQVIGALTAGGTTAVKGGGEPA
jgi:hypothetical protein